MSDIRVTAVRKDYGSMRVLHDVSLEVRDQEFVVLLGPSGCGKTTLLRIIAGLDSQTAGTVEIGGRDVSRLPPRARRLAMVFQNYAVFPHLTVGQNIGFGLAMKRLPKPEIDRRVERAATLMHLEALLGRYPSQLSGGQRQRVAVARALAVEPEVLLMDEPLSNLDALLRLEMRAELKGLLQQSRTTTIYVTHDQVEAMSLADRIAVMQGGRLVQYDRPLDVYSRPASRFVGGFIGNPPMNFLEVERAADGRAVVGGCALAAPSGAVVLGVRPEDLSLADAGIAAVAALVEPLGPHLLVTARVGTQMLRVTLPPDARVAAGQTLTLAPSPERIRWLDAQTGQAVA